MSRRNSFAWLPLLALSLAACADAGPVAPADDFDLEGTEPMEAVLPDLAPEAGTAGTERYVPTLGRVFLRAVPVVRERAGKDAADRLVTQVRTLHQAVKDAREAQDQAALEEAVRKLEGFQAGVGFRVFGVKLVRHVHGDAAGKLQKLSEQVKAAEDAGQDVTRQKAGAQMARRHLAAARDAAGKERPVVALLHAAHALDLVVRIAASL